MTSITYSSRVLVGSLVACMVALALFAGVRAANAQVSYPQIYITTQLANGVGAPTTLPTVTVTANGPSFYSVPSNSGPTLTYTSNFLNDTRTVTVITGTYNITASGGGYYYSYSPDCAGSIQYSGTKSCTITLSTTPPASAYPCSSWYGSTYGYGCSVGVTPYVGSYTQIPLSCSPSYQTVGVGQAVTFTAQGGSGYSNSVYNWTTSDRTYLSTGSVLSVVLQHTGVQTVTVDSGSQSATCTVNVVADNVPVTYIGSNTGTPIVTTYTPTFIPALPNTGYEPTDGVAIAFATIFLLAGGIVAFPYVRKTTHSIIG